MHEHADQPLATPRAESAPRDRSTDDKIGDVLALQRTAGNQAVCRLLARQNNPSCGDQIGRALALQRTAGNQAVNTLLARQTKTTEAPLPPKTGGSIVVLPDERQTIKDETTAEILTAFTAFTDACQANLTAMKAAAKADAEIVAMVIDIATGFLAPAFATWFSRKLAAKALT